MKIFKNIGDWFKGLAGEIKDAFSSRTRRIKTSILILEAIDNFADSDEASFLKFILKTVVPVVATPVSTVLTTVKEVAPKLIEILNIMDKADPDKTTDENAKIISDYLSEKKGSAISATTLNMVYGFLKDNEKTKKNDPNIISFIEAERLNNQIQ